MQGSMTQRPCSVLKRGAGLSCLILASRAAVHNPTHALP